MGRYQFYILTLSLIICLTISFSHQTHAKPLNDVIEDAPTTASTTQTGDNKPIPAALAPYFKLGMRPPFIPFFFGNLPIQNQV